MSVSESAGPPGENAPEDEPELFDINGNPIPRNWNPMAPPAPPGAKPSGGRKPPSANRPPGSGQPPPAYQPPRQAMGGGFTVGLGAMPGEEEQRLDLTGKPLPPMKASSAPVQPTYGSSGRSSQGPQRTNSGGNPLGAVFALLLVVLIAGAGYVMYTKYQANQQNQAKPAAGASSGSPSGTKPHTVHASPFGGKQ